MLLATRKIVTPVLGNSLFNNNKEECCLVSFPAEEYRTAEKGKNENICNFKSNVERCKHAASMERTSFLRNPKVRVIISRSFNLKNKCSRVSEE